VVRVPTAPPPTESDDATEQFLTFEAVADLLGRIAACGGLVLMLDDLHWTEPTARWEGSFEAAGHGTSAGPA